MVTLTVAIIDPRHWTAICRRDATACYASCDRLAMYSTIVRAVKAVAPLV